jgi:hypothetical protein
MKHAGPRALDALEPLLRKVRSLQALRERRRGTFYRRGRAFLHFHEDPAGLFADVRLTSEFERFAASTAEDRRRLMAAIRKALRN